MRDLSAGNCLIPRYYRRSSGKKTYLELHCPIAVVTSHNVYYVK